MPIELPFAHVSYGTPIWRKYSRRPLAIAN
jgi:hypothetical protein